MTLAAGVIIETEVVRATRADRREGKEDFLRVTFWALESNGIRISRDEGSKSIDQYEGERQVTSLPIFPRRFRDSKDGGETYRYMEERGERLYKLIHAQPRLMWYDGYFYSSKKRKVRLLCLGQPMTPYNDSIEAPQSSIQAQQSPTKISRKMMIQIMDSFLTNSHSIGRIRTCLITLWKLFRGLPITI